MNSPCVRLSCRPLWTFSLVLFLGLLTSAHATNYYLTVAGAGTKDGSSWTNAYDATALGPTVNTTMQPGDTLYIGGPDNSGGATYGDQRLTISSSGTSTAPKSLIGVDRGFGVPQFIGIQSTRSYTTITLADTVSYWTIKDLYIAHRDYGIATAGAGHLGIVLDGVIVHDIRSACYSFTDCDGLLVQNCRAERYTALGFMCNNSCDGVTFSNCVADCTGTGSYDDTAWKATVSSPVGFNFNVKNSGAAPNTDILLEDCESLNNDEDTSDPNDYEQGDGFKSEQGNVGVTFLRCLSHANQDGAFDLKGSNQTLQDCKAVNNLRYGFKIWYDGTLTNCVSVNNSARQFTFAALSSGYTVTLEHCTFHCADTTQVGAIIETAGNTLVMNNSILSFAGSAGTYTGGSGSFTSNATVKLANASNTANSPQYTNPVIPWDGSGTNYDSATYGSTKGYNSAGYTPVGGGGVTTDTFPDADTYVWDGSKGTNYGTATTLAVKQGTSSYNRVSYLRFTIPAGGSVLSATLHLKVITAGTSPATVEIRELTDDSWSETGMTWNNRPSSTGVQLASIDASTAGQDYGIDVTNFVAQQAAGDGTVSFVLVQPAGVATFVGFGSRENTGNEPVLEVVRDVQSVLPEADTYVWDGSPNTNYGTDTGLVVKNASSGYNRISYLRFPLAGTGSFTTATLHLKLITAGTSPATVQIRELTDDSWSETGTTWNNRPSSAGTLIATIDASTVGQDYSIDVSSYVSQQAAGDGKVSFVLVQPSGVSQFVKFGSRENAGNEPLLQFQ